MQDTVQKDDEARAKLAQEVGSAAAACLRRSLFRSALWLSKLQAAMIPDIHSEPLGLEASNDEREEARDPSYIAASSLFGCREYERASHACRKARGPLCRFLHFYSRFFAVEERRLSQSADLAGAAPPDISEYHELRKDMEAEIDTLDGYALYVYGLVLKALGFKSDAGAVMERVVRQVPWLWCARIELAALRKRQDAFEALQPPDHFLSRFFLAHQLLELKCPDDALLIYESLKADGLHRFDYIDAQIAIAHHDRRDVERAIVHFRRVESSDPYRLDNLDLYSHLLYVKEMRAELTDLARKAVHIDKYRVETCCITGNYYSLRGERHKAILYFERALKLNPDYMSAWILMGHEYIELQNTNAAILSYRRAIEIDGSDYRAWNGLGQAYEILGLNGYCLYYYSRASKQCPNDSRMFVALGEAYEKLNKLTSAAKCYRRAHSAGDVEGMAMLKLAHLFDKMKMFDSAAAAYTNVCSEIDPEYDRGLQEAYRYLANFHLFRKNLDEAHNYAFKCLEYEQTKEEGKALLKSIALQKRYAPKTQAPNKEKEESDPGTSRESTPRMTRSRTASLLRRYKL